MRSQPPSLDDFTSDHQRGRPRPRDPDLARLWDGLSLFATEEQARNKAQAYPWLGPYIAEVVIPHDSPIRIERTLPRSRGHHTAWAPAHELLACVVATVAVARVQ